MRWSVCLLFFALIFTFCDGQQSGQRRRRDVRKLMSKATEESWPPLNCKRPVKIQDNSVVLTSAQQNNVKSRCDILNVYDKSIYMKFSRVYNIRQTGTSDSVLSLDFLFGSETKFSLEIHNDRVKVKSTEYQDLRTSRDSCMAVLARPELDWYNWMRVRVNHLDEIRKTFISVDLVSYEGNTFVPCLRFETNLLERKYKLSLSGYTESGMRQEVMLITQKKPDLNKYSTQELSSQIKNIENRVDRLQNSLQKYMGYHDDHVSRVSDAHENFKKQIVGARNGLKSRAESHMLFYFVVLILTGTGICWWVSYRFKQEKRFHLL